MFQTLVDGPQRCLVALSTSTQHAAHDVRVRDSPVTRHQAVSHYFVAINITLLPTRHFKQDTPDRAPVTMKLKALNACPLTAQIDITEA